MATGKAAGTPGDAASRTRRHTLHLRTNAARITPGLNAHAAVNSAILAAGKTEIRYRNGETLPASAQQLLADARRKDLKHSTMLAGNMAAAGVVGVGCGTFPYRRENRA